MTVALLLLALPLAGCTAPAWEEQRAMEPDPHPHAASPERPSAASSPDDAPTAGSEDPLLERVQDCSEGRKRRQEFHVEEVVVQVTSCIRAIAHAADQRVATEPRDVDETFDVAPGADRLRVLFHLHGPERVRVWLHYPGGTTVERGASGAGDVHSVVEYEMEAPPIGTWRVTAAVEETVAARPWSLVSAIGYGEGA